MKCEECGSELSPTNGKCLSRGCTTKRLRELFKSDTLYAYDPIKNGWVPQELTKMG